MAETAMSVDLLLCFFFFFFFFFSVYMRIRLIYTGISSKINAHLPYIPHSLHLRYNVMLFGGAKTKHYKGTALYV